MLRKLVMAGLACLLLSLSQSGRADDGGWQSRLVGKALYLRGFWLSDELAFDGEGNPIGSPQIGPITLSGIDITSAAVNGHILTLHGVRVALVLKPGNAPGLERMRLLSITHMLFSLRSKGHRDFRSTENVSMKIEADASAHFDTALSRIFVEGLPELATIVPVYWQCYAKAYFVPAQPSETAEKDVKQCVVSPSVPTGDEVDPSQEGVSSPPVLLQSIRPDVPPFAAELGVYGTVVVHLRVRSDGVPVGIQVVRALGAGVDEAVMQAVSQDRFKPAMRAGTAVDANMDLTSDIVPGP